MILKILQNPDYKELPSYFIDLSDALDGDEQIYIDTCHLSPNGNKIIAKILYEYIQDITQKR